MTELRNDEPLEREAVDFFTKYGYLVIEGFYDVETEIAPIWRGARDVIDLVAKTQGLAASSGGADPDSFDIGYKELVKVSRDLGGVVYDAVKQIWPFVRLGTSERNEAVFKQLRKARLAGVAAGGLGVRIDNPSEDQFGAPWHQEYPGQFRSLDGLVFWSPLREVTPELGPVEICVASHKDGLRRVLRGKGPPGSYAVYLEDEESVIARYEHIAPLTKPGDLIVMDFLTIHRSGMNRAVRSRWSMTFRYFNFEEPTGMKIGWAGSFAAGNEISDVHPELVAAYVDRSPTSMGSDSAREGKDRS